MANGHGNMHIRQSFQLLISIVLVGVAIGCSDKTESIMDKNGKGGPKDGKLTPAAKGFSGEFQAIALLGSSWADPLLRRALNQDPEVELDHCFGAHEVVNNVEILKFDNCGTSGKQRYIGGLKIARTLNSNGKLLSLEITHTTTSGQGLLTMIVDYGKYGLTTEFKISIKLARVNDYMFSLNETIIIKSTRATDDLNKSAPATLHQTIERAGYIHVHGPEQANLVTLTTNTLQSKMFSNDGKKTKSFDSDITMDSTIDTNPGGNYYKCGIPQGQVRFVNQANDGEKDLAKVNAAFVINEQELLDQGSAKRYRLRGLCARDGVAKVRLEAMESFIHTQLNTYFGQPRIAEERVQTKPTTKPAVKGKIQVGSGGASTRDLIQQ